MSALDGKTVVLIAGQPKAGTTSLFHWLEHHPKIGAGKIKELRFFLDSDYPLKSIARYDGNNLDSYAALFNHNDRPVLLDASPDYMGCETPLNLPKLHQDTKAIFIIRNSVDRMKSAYRFFKSLGRIPKTMSFNDYVAKQNEEGVTSTTQVQYRALDHCRSEHYLQVWSDAYGDNLLILDFKSLKSEPQKVMDEVCKFIGIESVHIQHAEQKNKTQLNRAPKLFKFYTDIRRWFGQNTIRHPYIFKGLRPIGKVIKKFFFSAQLKEMPIEISDHTLSIINAATQSHLKSSPPMKHMNS